MDKHESREYQDRIEELVMNYLFEESGNPIVAAPGGCGKSFIMAKLTKRFVTEWPGTRVVVLAQDAKLLRQNRKELERYWPNAPCGTYSAGLKQRDTLHPVLFAGIQSAYKVGDQFGKVNIVLLDEADLMSAKDDALYGKFLEALRKNNPKLRVVGFTASPYRMGTGCLTNLPLWDKIVIDLTQGEEFMWFVDNGYLSPLINKAGVKQVDITNVGMVAGEFNEKELNEITDTEEMNTAVISECLKYGADRKHWLMFSSGVPHGYKLAKLLNSKGVPTEMLCAKDSMEHRSKVEAEWHAGRVRCVVNAGLYGRGYDFKAIDFVIWARATNSVALWLQGCVRGSRVAKGKENCLILDMASNTRRLGPINALTIPTPRRKGQAPGEAPIRECPECHSYLPIQTRTCPDCGFVFPPPKTIEKKASSAEIMVRKVKDTNPVIEEFYVLGIRYKPTLSKKGKYYLKITYSVGTASFHEALWFDHAHGSTRKNLEKWWTYRGGLLPIPDGVDEAADRAPNELNVPTLIRVDINTKYKEVVGADFDPDAKMVEPEDDFSDIPF